MPLGALGAILIGLPAAGIATWYVLTVGRSLEADAVAMLAALASDRSGGLGTVVPLTAEGNTLGFQREGRSGEGPGLGVPAGGAELPRM